MKRYSIKNKLLSTIFLLILIVFPLNANNIQVNNVILTNQDTVNNTVNIQFDVSWQNSWKVSSAPNNYDAT